MNPFAISGLLTGITSLAFGYFVYLQGKTRTLNRLWFIFTVSVAVWGFGGMWIGIAKNDVDALLAWRVAFSCGVLWIPILFYHFIVVFCGLSRRNSLVLSYIIGILFFPLIFTDQFFSGVRFTFSSFYYSVPGMYLFPIFAMWWIGMVVYSHYELIRAYKVASAQMRNQIKYFFLATAIGYSGGSLDYLPVFGFDLYPFGNFAIIAFPVIMTYAIMKHRLMDISVVLHKGLAYVLLLSTIFVPIYLIIAITQRATLYSMPPLVAGTLIFACGLWVVFKNSRASPNVTFSLVCIAVFVWLFGVFMAYSTDDAQNAQFWGRFTYLGIVYIPAFFYHFCISFLQRPQRKLLFSSYLISTAFLLFVPTNYFIMGQYSYFWGYYPKAGILHPFFLVYFFSVSGFSLFMLFPPDLCTPDNTASSSRFAFG